MKKIIFLLLILILAGCSSSNPEQYTQEQPASVPYAEPKPVSVYFLPAIQGHEKNIDFVEELYILDNTTYEVIVHKGDQKYYFGNMKTEKELIFNQQPLNSLSNKTFSLNLTDGMSIEYIARISNPERPEGYYAPVKSGKNLHDDPVILIQPTIKPLPNNVSLTIRDYFFYTEVPSGTRLYAVLHQPTELTLTLESKPNPDSDSGYDYLGCHIDSFENANIFFRSTSDYRRYNLYHEGSLMRWNFYQTMPIKKEGSLKTDEPVILEIIPFSEKNQTIRCGFFDGEQTMEGYKLTDDYGHDLGRPNIYFNITLIQR